jgi:hypothetical protein
MEKGAAPDCGYLYVAVGDAYVREAVRSAVRLREVDPKAHVTLVTEEPCRLPAFDRVVVRGRPCASLTWQEGLLYRARHLYECSPYRRTLFLDTDTYVVENCRALFELLRYFDACLVPAPCDIVAGAIEGALVEGLFPYNMGVILFRASAATRELFADWARRYEAKVRGDALGPGESDQTAFVEALAGSPARIFALRNNYNARLPFLIQLCGRVKILHGRDPDMAAVARAINRAEGNRVWDPRRRRCWTAGSWRGFGRRLWRALRPGLDRSTLRRLLSRARPSPPPAPPRATGISGRGTAPR